MERREGQTRLLREITSSWALLATAHEIKTIIEQYPEGRGVTVVVPHAKLIPHLESLVFSYARYVHITTFSLLAEQVPLHGQIVGEYERQQLVYDALVENSWFEEHYRWHFAQESVRLMDELNLQGIIWPNNESELAQTLASAYQSALSQPLQFEARVVHTLWQLLHDSSRYLSSSMAYLARLKNLPKYCSMNVLMVMEASIRYPAERQFLEDISDNVLIKIIATEPIQHSKLRDWLSNLWLHRSDIALVDWANSYKTRCHDSPLINRVNLVACDYFEQETEFAVSWIEARIKNNQVPVMVIAQDRQSVRRLQACLSSKNIPFEDTTGWIFSTTTVVAAIKVCLNLAQRGFSRQGLFELFHIPWFMGDEEENERCQLIEQLINDIGQFSNQSQLNKWLVNVTVLEEENNNKTNKIKRALLTGLSLFQHRRLSLSGWINQLFQLLECWSMFTSLTKDMAGQQFLEYLQQLLSNKQHQQGLYAFNEWVGWLEEVLESSYFKPEYTNPVVTFSQLSQSLYISSTATLVLGIDSTQLPYIPVNPIFGESVRKVFGLPLREDFLEESTKDIMELIEHSNTIVMTYRTQINGAQSVLAPMIDLMENTHKYMYGSSLFISTQSSNIENQSIQVTRPKVSIPANKFPQTVTASFYQRVMNCPYQAFLYDILCVKKPFPVTEGVTKAEFGQLVHRVLEKVVVFKKCHPNQTWHDCLMQVTDSLWQPVLEEDPYWQAWYVYWCSLIPVISEWFDKREQANWQTIGIEQHINKLKHNSRGEEFELVGNIDRLDTKVEDGQQITEILDYKLRSSKHIIRKDIESGEEIQLPFYAQLLDELEPKTSYVFLEDQPIREVSINHLFELSEKIMERWFDIVNDTRNGISWPANGTTKTCEYCQYQGVCRRQYWN